MRIVNRWGNLVFETNDVNEVWYGPANEDSGALCARRTVLLQRGCIQPEQSSGTQRNYWFGLGNAITAPTFNEKSPGQRPGLFCFQVSQITRSKRAIHPLCPWTRYGSSDGPWRRWHPPSLSDPYRPWPCTRALRTCVGQSPRERFPTVHTMVGIGFECSARARRTKLRCYRSWKCPTPRQVPPVVQGKWHRSNWRGSGTAPGTPTHSTASRWSLSSLLPIRPTRRPRAQCGQS